MEQRPATCALGAAGRLAPRMCARSNCDGGGQLNWVGVGECVTWMRDAWYWVTRLRDIVWAVVSRRGEQNTLFRWMHIMCITVVLWYCCIVTHGKCYDTYAHDI